jgi:hypothetical protein
MLQLAQTYTMRNIFVDLLDAAGFFTLVLLGEPRRFNVTTVATPAPPEGGVIRAPDHHNALDGKWQDDSAH